jgi:hypothetical protein
MVHPLVHRPQRVDQRRDAARAEEEEEELEEPPARVQHVHHRRRLLHDLRGDAARVGSRRADMEDEGAADRIGIG